MSALADGREESIDPGSCGAQIIFIELQKLQMLLRTSENVMMNPFF